MPFALGGLGLALMVFCLIHAVKTGADRVWITVLIFLPGVGSIAYLLVEVLPHVMRSPQAHAAGRHLQKTIDPERDYRARQDDVEELASVSRLAALAEEASKLGRHREAVALLQRCVEGPYADDARLLLKLATAQLDAGEAGQAVATLDRLRAANPTFQSSDGHLTYARAKAANGEVDEALAEYRALVDYFPGPEAACRYAALLTLAGRDGEARGVWQELKRRYDRSPRHVRRFHAPWWDQVLANAGG